MRARHAAAGALAWLALGVAASAWSQASSPVDHAGHHPVAGAWAPAPAAVPMALGEVRHINLAAGKITLRHGETASLKMAPMTMVFQAAPAALLERVKVGDKVRFQADQQDGNYRVTDLQPAD